MKLTTIILGLLVLGLTGLGIVVLASTSNVQAANLFNDPYRFLIQQAKFFGVAVLCCTLVARIRPRFWFSEKTAVAVCVLILLGLVSVHIPHLGKEINGAYRWINLGPLRLQPSEFVKLGAILLMAWWQGRKWCKNNRIMQGAFIPFAGLGIIALGFFTQPDFGSVVMLGAVNVTIMFVAGVKIRHMAPFFVLGLIVITVLVLRDPIRLKRVMSVLPSSSVREQVVTKDDTFQLDQSIIALRSGGLTGVGIGESLRKQRYLPENHTDFVFAMLGEELGLSGTLLCILLYIGVLICGMRISIGAYDERLRLLAFGMTLHICLSGAVNIGVVTGLFPTKGLALPFLSYGGSNLMSSFIAIGFIMSVGRCSLPATPAAERCAHTSWNE